MLIFIKELLVQNKTFKNLDKNENGELSNLFTAQINRSRKNMLTF